MTGQDALRRAVDRLRLAGIEDAVRDARILVAYAMGVASDRLTLHLTDDLVEAVLQRLDAALSARAVRQPISQIVGSRLFWGHRFTVTPNVLDPRPETEVLVAEVLKRPFSRVLDLGTGTGCILISCLLGMPKATGVGIDISQAALAVAQSNADMLHVADRCQFLISDWFQEVQESFDLIVSNPPYIAKDEMSALSQDVRDWEPVIALSPGGDGLAAYRQIAFQAPRFLTSGGRIVVEIGPTQADAVRVIFAAQGLTGIETLPDFDGRDRVVSAMNPI